MCSKSKLQVLMLNNVFCLTAKYFGCPEDKFFKKYGLACNDTFEKQLYSPSCVFQAGATGKDDF